MTTPVCPRCGLTIDEHPANECLNVWVAEKVMRFRFSEGVWYYSDQYGMLYLPDFSTGIAAAWAVVEKWHPGGLEGYNVELQGHAVGYTFLIFKDGTDYEGTSVSASLSICRAALKAAYAQGE